jgi:putative lipoprotein (rSAM/lipoprotein system)
MRIKLLQGGNRIIAFFMAILGFASSCRDSFMAAMYGSPYADYIVKGKIVSEKDNSSIKGIQISISASAGAAYTSRTEELFSDSKGNYSVIYKEYGITQINLRFSDADGVENGSYQSVDTLMTFSKSDLTGKGSNYFMGSSEKVLNIKLKPKL